MPQVIKQFLKYFFYTISATTLLIAGLVAYLIWFQPPFYFPKPTGPYAVGVQDFHWIDTNRKETLADDPAHPYRELMVKIWYPSSVKLPETPTKPYDPHLVEYLKKHHKDRWLSGGLSRLIYSYAQPNISLASDKLRYPVILFSHGFSWTRESNTAHCEELASHGYVVVGISHTYDSSVVQFPDGRSATKVEFSSNDAKSSPVEHEKHMNQEIEIWISDVRFVLDHIEQLAHDKESIFYERIDPKNIGAFGHSFGGATAAHVCHRDSRVKAGVDLDGRLYGPEIKGDFNKPFMFMVSAENAQKNLSSFNRLTQSIGHDGYTLVVKGSGHVDFFDYAFLVKHASLISRTLIACGAGNKIGIGSIIDGFRATTIVSDYLVNFFDKYLKSKSSELLDGRGNRYPEVERKQWTELK